MQFFVEFGYVFWRWDFLNNSFVFSLTGEWDDDVLTPCSGSIVFLGNS